VRSLDHVFDELLLVFDELLLVVECSDRFEGKEPKPPFVGTQRNAAGASSRLISWSASLCPRVVTG